MKKILRILFVLLITLMPLAGVSAQADDVFCGTLTTADCELLHANRVADADLTSLTYELHITMSVVQPPGAEPQSFTINSAGAISYDKADLDAMNDEILNTTIGEVLTLLDNPDALVNRIVGYVDRLAKAPTAEVHVEVVLPTGVEEDIPGLSADFKMTDGVMYVTSPLLETVNMPPDTWVSLDLVEAVDMLVAQLQDPAFVEGMMSSTQGGVPGFPAPTSPGTGNEGPPAGEMQAMFARIGEIANAPYWEEMNSPEFKAQVITVTRLADTEIDGMPVAVFEERVDMAAMVASDPFQQAFHDIFTLFAQGASPEDMETLIPIILDMISQMEITSSQAIGLEDHFTYSESVSWSLTIDPNQFVAAIDPQEAQSNIPVQTQTFEFRQEIRDHNQPVVVTPPPAEKVISLLETILGWSPAS